MLDREKLISIAKGAGIAAAGAVLAYLSTVVIPAFEEGGTPLAVTLAAMASVAVNALRKALSDE